MQRPTLTVVPPPPEPAHRSPVEAPRPRGVVPAPRAIPFYPLQRILPPKARTEPSPSATPPPLPLALLADVASAEPSPGAQDLRVESAKGPAIVEEVFDQVIEEGLELTEEGGESPAAEAEDDGDMPQLLLGARVRYHLVALVRVLTNRAPSGATLADPSSSSSGPSVLGTRILEASTRLLRREQADPRQEAGPLVLVTQRTLSRIRSGVQELPVWLKDLRSEPEARNRLAVSTYKLLGFIVLTMIVVCLTSYLAAGLFYFLSTSWVRPTVVSATDQRVLALGARYAEQASARDNLAVELKNTKRLIEMHRRFQRDFRSAVAADLRDRQQRLANLRQLTQTYGASRQQILQSTRAYSGMSRRRLAELRRAQLLDREELVDGQFQLAQLANADLSLAERQTEIETKTSTVEREARSLDALVRDRTGELSYDVLNIRAVLERSIIELKQAEDRRPALEAGIARYDRMLAAISGSPYLRAAQSSGTIAFVPYDNLSQVEPETPLYGCWLGFVFCRRVGKVVSILSGEESERHPFNNETVRGRMLEVRLEQARWAQKRVLFAGRAPLLL